MITLRSIRSAQESHDTLHSFDPVTSTWLVSDLKSKLDLNRELLRERRFLRGEAVLRASELWKLLLSRVRPDLQIVSREFSLTVIAELVSRLDLPWAQAPGVAQAAFSYVSQLTPILAHPSGDEIMTEWFEKNSGARERWGRWFDLAKNVWSEFLEQGYIAPAWASGVLVNEENLHEIWKRPLFVDLGAELSQVEADLLLQLGDHLDIVVLRPQPEWAEEYSKSLIAYEILEAKIGARHVKSPAREFAPPSRVSYRKYTTMIAEVKDAVAQARLWMDAGAKPSDIAIVAPDIEIYWPALESFLDEEGIPTQKDRVRRLHTFADVAQWLALLRLRTGAFDESDIELALFAPGDRGPDLTSDTKSISYERFKTLYAMVYGREDLARTESISKRFAIELEPGERASRDDFVAWSLKQLPNSIETAGLDRVTSAFKKIFSECAPGVIWPTQRWLAYLEQIVARTECRVSDGDPDGVACIKLSSAENAAASKMILMGLTEGALRQSVETALLAGDLWSLAKDYGFHLASEDQARLEFEARWVIETGGRELLLTVPETDFNGAALAPSWLWLKGARLAKEGLSVSVPRATRWDELQAAPTSEIARTRNWNSTSLARLERAFDEDFGKTEIDKFGLGLVKRLNPSGIEDYLECPFIFAAKRLFGMNDAAELDLEIDPSRRGSLMHEVFELLTAEPIRFELTDEELGAVVDRARELAEIELADPRLWPPLRARHVDLGRRFLAFEREYRRRFPDAKVVGREFSVIGYLKPETGELVRDEEPGSIAFAGRIDRIDEDSEGNVAIYDYKSSDSTTSQFGSWVKNNRIQLLLYSLAIEKGLSVLGPRQVLAAIYYVARPLSRDTGFKVEDVEQGLFDFENRRKQNRLSAEQKAALFRQSEELVRSAVEGILAGSFAPRPRDPTLCDTCRWSALCRTPHLNS